MASSCKACIVTCEDFRLHRRADGVDLVGRFVMSLGVDCDVITRAGGVQDLVRPPGPGFDESVLRDVRLAIELHGVRTIYLIQHEACGAYRAFHFPDAAAERRQHIADLRDAREILRERFGDVSVITLLAELDPGSEDRFTIHPVEDDDA